MLVQKHSPSALSPLSRKTPSPFPSSRHSFPSRYQRKRKPIHCGIEPARPWLSMDALAQPVVQRQLHTYLHATQHESSRRAIRDSRAARDLENHLFAEECCGIAGCRLTELERRGNRNPEG
jgi:hypothetical protein